MLFPVFCFGQLRNYMVWKTTVPVRAIQNMVEIKCRVMVPDE